MKPRYALILLSNLLGAQTLPEFPFAQIQAELRKEAPADPKATLQARATQALATVKDKEVDLPPAAQSALAVTEPWKQDVQVPAAGEDGRVVYTFGAGLATVVCAPLRICVVELQPGEQFVGEPHIGDSVRWNVSPAAAGTGNAAMSLVIIKPKEAGLDTNLVVPTNRRSYYIRLVSRQTEYLPLVAFTYPDDDAARWRMAVRVREQQRAEEEATHVSPVESLENLNFNYSVTGGTEHLRPVRVLDDGKKTYLQMSEATAVREAPVLVVSGQDSTAEMVNYRVKGNMYIVDRLFERAALLLGSGKKQERVDIVRGRAAK